MGDRSLQQAKSQFCGRLTGCVPLTSSRVKANSSADPETTQGDQGLSQLPRARAPEGVQLGQQLLFRST